MVKLRERLGAAGWKDEVILSAGAFDFPILQITSRLQTIPQVMVGTTEEFQGQERMVILLSTVW